MTNIFQQNFLIDVCIRKVGAYYRAIWENDNQIEQKNKHIVPIIKHERESDTSNKIKKKKEIEKEMFWVYNFLNPTTNFKE